MNAGEDVFRLLGAREERVYVQGFLLSREGIDFVVQISLNLPGLPKSVPGDPEAVFFASGILSGRLGDVPALSVQLRNHAGLACLMSFRGDAVRAKKTAVSVEKGFDWGRGFDIDVLTGAGPVSRENLGMKARKCFLCAENAKICARAGAHDMEKLREEALRLLALARLRP
ncbi:MAG: citrate lyase holo-[acyl-carrier protein] synthase [Synergistaceae bacterium]|jgi:holo-ACP synthase|nr:citrate lyase holo-[acyl-carrier protein] synthase [Synergistaceae bacterium]